MLLLQQFQDCLPNLGESGVLVQLRKADANLQQAVHDAGPGKITDLFRCVVVIDHVEPVTPDASENVYRV